MKLLKDIWICSCIIIPIIVIQQGIQYIYLQFGLDIIKIGIFKYMGLLLPPNMIIDYMIIKNFKSYEKHS